MTYIYAHFFSNGDKYIGISNVPKHRWKQGFDPSDPKQYNHKVLIANEKYDRLSLIISEDLPRRIAEKMESILINSDDTFNLNIKKEIPPNLHGNDVICIHTENFSHVYPKIDGEILYHSRELEENNNCQLSVGRELTRKEIEEIKKEEERLKELAKQKREYERLDRLGKQNGVTIEEIKKEEERLKELAKQKREYERLDRLAKQKRGDERLDRLAKETGLTIEEIKKEEEKKKKIELEKQKERKERLKKLEVEKRKERLDRLAKQKGVTIEEIKRLEMLKRLAKQNGITMEEIKRLEGLAKRRGIAIGKMQIREEIARQEKLERLAKQKREEERLGELARYRRLTMGDSKGSTIRRGYTLEEMEYQRRMVMKKELERLAKQKREDERLDRLAKQREMEERLKKLEDEKKDHRDPYEKPYDWGEAELIDHSNVERTYTTDICKGCGMLKKRCRCGNSKFNITNSTYQKDKNKTISLKMEERKKLLEEKNKEHIHIDLPKNYEDLIDEPDICGDEDDDFDFMTSVEIEEKEGKEDKFSEREEYEDKNCGVERGYYTDTD